MYKFSKFIIELKRSNTVILYSTLTTSIVELEKDIYNDIFNKKMFSQHQDYVTVLYEMGFLIDEDYDELAFLQEIRDKTIKANETDPTYYIIAPTMDCNARCYYCFEHGAVKRNMTFETAEAVAKYIILNHDKDDLIIQWFGGEPLLKPEIISYISNRLKTNNVKFKSKIITNGYLLNNDIIQKAINEWNVETIQITIDDIGDKYNKIKNYVYENVDAFSVVMNNIRQCLSHGLKIRVRINFNPIKYNETIDIVKYLADLFNKDENYFMYLAPIDSSSSKIPSITDEFKTEKVHPLIALLNAEEKSCGLGNFNIQDVNDDDKMSILLQKYYLSPIPTSCYGGCESAVTIDADGDIYVCHRLMGRKEYSSGNVFTGKVHNEIYKHYANTVIDSEECNNCKLLPICQGGCKHRAFAYGKNRSCTPVKGSITQLLERVIKEL